jgi:hypothetical protein
VSGRICASSVNFPPRLNLIGFVVDADKDRVIFALRKADLVATALFSRRIAAADLCYDSAILREMMSLPWVSFFVFRKWLKFD